MRKAFILLALAALPLAACKKEAASNARAAGEVLPGSISDAMLPEDRVTSQPPLDPGAVRVKGSSAPAEEASAQPEAAPATGASEPAATKAAD